MRQGFYDKNYFDARTRQSLPHTREVVYPLAERTAQMLCRRLRPLRVLDIGCAKGFLVEAFCAEGTPAVFGTDISLYAVCAGDATIRHRLTVSDASEGLPFRTSSFDLVTAVDVFEHLLDPMEALGEIRRVVRGDGVAYLKICHPRHPNAARDPSHVNVRSLAYWRERFREAGFRHRRVYEAEWRPRRRIGDWIRALLSRGIEWAAIGVPADYKFILKKACHG
jgi:SAM-dependent methyltransferase